MKSRVTIHILERERSERQRVGGRKREEEREGEEEKENEREEGGGREEEGRDEGREGEKDLHASTFP